MAEFKLKGFRKYPLLKAYKLNKKVLNVREVNESAVHSVQLVTNDVYCLRWLGPNCERKFFALMNRSNVLAYGIMQKYPHDPYFTMLPEPRVGEPALVYSLERRKGFGTLLFYDLCLRVLKDYDVSIFKCEAVIGNVFDKKCKSLGLNSAKDNIFNVYKEDLRVKGKRSNLEEKFVDFFRFE